MFYCESYVVTLRNSLIHRCKMQRLTMSVRDREKNGNSMENVALIKEQCGVSTSEEEKKTNYSAQTHEQQLHEHQNDENFCQNEYFFN